MLPTRSTLARWLAAGTSVLAIASSAWADDARVPPAAAPSAVAAQSPQSPVDITILETVSLPWQQPEVIVSTTGAAEILHVAVVIDGAAGPTLDENNIFGGQNRSLTWKAAVGKHRCEVRAWGMRDGSSFRQVWSSTVNVVPPLQVELAAGDVDLAQRTLHFRSNAAVASTELSIFDVDGNVLHQASTAVTGARIGKAISVTWPALTAPAAKLALRVFGGAEGAETWADVEWAPVQVEVPHEPIFFRDTIVLGSRADKLNAAYQAVKRVAESYTGVPGLRLYVLGLAKLQDQAEFAADRARAVAKYFKDRGGVGLPIVAGASVEPDTDATNTGYVQAFVAVDEPAHNAWTPVDASVRGDR